MQSEKGDTYLIHDPELIEDWGVYVVPRKHREQKKAWLRAIAVNKTEIMDQTPGPHKWPIDQVFEIDTTVFDSKLSCIKISPRLGVALSYLKPVFVDEKYRRKVEVRV